MICTPPCLVEVVSVVGLENQFGHEALGASQRAQTSVSPKLYVVEVTCFISLLCGCSCRFCACNVLVDSTPIGQPFVLHAVDSIDFVIQVSNPAFCFSPGLPGRDQNKCVRPYGSPQTDQTVKGWEMPGGHASLLRCSRAQRR